jgi:hypothetical protein
MLVTVNVVIALLLILSFYSGKGKTVPVYTMKACGRVEVYFPSFLTLALDGGMWSLSHNGHFYPLEWNYGTHRTEGCVGPRSGLAALEKHKISSLYWRLNNNFWVVKLWPKLSTDQAVPAAVLQWSCVHVEPVILGAPKGCGLLLRNLLLPEQQHPYFLLPRYRQHNLLEHGASTWETGSTLKLLCVVIFQVLELLNCS